MDLDEEHLRGYLDGRNPFANDPSYFSTAAYKHSFKVGRAEIANEPIRADVSRRRAAMIASAHGNGGSSF